jgi:amino acid adenylation domain-containing protein
VEQLTPGEPVHNISFEYRYAGRIEPGALRAALADVVARHESLRTALVVRDGELCQVVSTPPDEPPLEFVDLSAAADPDPAYRELCATVGTAPFDLGAPPLLRLRHVRLSAGTDALVVVVHHMVADATSVSIMLRDLTAAYEHRLAGRAPDWPELAVQYADFTAWQQEQAGGTAAQADLAYWRQQLAELPTLDLTHGRRRPARLTQRARRLPLTIDPDLAAALDEFVRAEHATPFAAFLAAYAATLGRVFGGTDLAVASTVAGRPLPEVREVVGMFVDRVVLRLDLSGGPTFRELVRSARQVVADAHDHTGVTFDQVAAAVAPQRVTGLTPLAQAAINLQPPAVARPAAGRMPAIATGSSIDTGTVADDLWLDLAAAPVPYSGEVRYRPDVVGDAAAERVRAVFQLLLRNGLAEPDRPLWTFDVVAPAELADLRGPAATEDGDTLLPELIEARATATPAAPAVVWAGGALDYAGLDAAANRLAHTLLARGVRPEEPVLVALPRTVELVVAFLGVLKAGGVYVPVDAGAPAGHLARITEQCAARIAVAAADVALPDTVARVAVAAAPGQDPGRPESAARPANAAYVMFTSGSTGAPKGVVVTHRAVVAFVRGLLTVLPPGASHLLVQPPTFDSSLTPILCALAGGGALHLADEATAQDADALGGFVTAHPADFLKITPSHLTALLAGADPATLRPRRAVVLSGEPVRQALVRRLRDAGWGVVVQYGPTETDTVTAAWLDGVDPAGPPLGRPLPGVSAQVLDRWGRPVPPGCAGELHLGGPQVARGYLGAPGATAGRFAPDPDRPGARRYRTGDLVRWQPGGWLEFCGRTDRQVKIRGFRVEPGAVEAVLLTHPGVRACAVVAAGADGDRRLVAYVAGDEHELDEAALREFVAARLPAYCVPGAVVVLAALPMTRHGKLDEAALPGGPEARTVRCAPATPLERALLAGWQRLLPQADFGVTDDFFDVGGDSILAIHAVAQARSHGMALTVRQVFDLRTVRAIARTLADSPAADHRPTPSITGPRPRRTCPASRSTAAC